MYLRCAYCNEQMEFYDERTGVMDDLIEVDDDYQEVKFRTLVTEYECTNPHCRATATWVIKRGLLNE